MSMIEIAHQLSDSANYLVASQDDIPDASWPYDRLLFHLVNNPKIEPEELAKAVAKSYVAGYSDYQKQPVTLSVSDLREINKTLPLMTELVKALKVASTDLLGRRAIKQARLQVRSFGQDEFIDLRGFCGFLTGVGARGTRGAEDNQNLSLAATARAFITGIDRSRFIVANERSKEPNDEPGCNGTSIYFPKFDPLRNEHQERLGELYNRELEFAQLTGWGEFVALFLKHEKEEAALTLELQKEEADPVRTEEKPNPSEPLKSSTPKRSGARKRPSTHRFINGSGKEKHRPSV